MTWRLLVLLFALVTPAVSQSRSARIPAPPWEELARTAQQAFNENRDEEAIRLYQQALKIKPDWDEGLWYLGVLFYEKDRFGECRDVLRQFVAQNPDHAPSWAVLGLSEYKTREYSRALVHLQRAIDLGVDDRQQLSASVFYYKAALLIRLEQFQDGLTLILQLRETGQPQDALESLAGLAALGYPFLPEEIPADRRELVRLAGAGTFALLAQRREDANNYFKKMVEQYPNEPGVHYQYGLLLLGDRVPEGLQEMQKELAISPSNIPARLRLAEHYVNESQPDQARPYLDEVLKLEPQNSTGHLLLGEALAKLGDGTGAIRELELAKQLDPNRSRILWALLRAYTSAGRIEDANRIKAEIAKSKDADSQK